MTGITGNLTTTGNGAVTAWYLLPGQQWAFRSDEAREAWIRQCAGQYAALAGVGAFRLHLRRTTRPWPTGQWAAGLLRRSHAADRAAEDVLLEHVTAARNWLDNARPAEPVTYLGVQVPAANPLTTGRIGALLRRGKTGGDDLHIRVAKVADLLTPPGLAAVPASETALAWLLIRSAGLGLTPPDRQATFLGAEALLEMAGRYRRYRTAYGTRVRYVDTVTGEEAWVAALTVGAMETQDIPALHDPWLHLPDQSGIDVELSSRISVVPAKAAAAVLGRRRDMLRFQRRDYLDKDLPVPPDLDRHAEHATAAADEAATGRPGEAARVNGWHHLAVWGASEADCEAKVAALVDLYEQRSRIVLRRSPEQARTLREFVPAEPAANAGFLRRLPVQLWAAAGAQVTVEVGDRTGDLIGRVAGTRTPVCWDPHRPMEVLERSGLALLVAEPGGGKSTLLGAAGALAAIRGVQTTLLDPSGPLAALAALPQLRGRVRTLNLVGAQAGTLAPYALVPTPQLRDFTDPAEHDLAVRQARAERKALVTDVCMMLLQPQLLRRDDVVVAVRQAVRRVPLEESSTLDDVVRSLADTGEVAAKLAAEDLQDAAELPLGGLLFGAPPAGLAGVDAPLMVITLAGLRLPNLAMAREDWTTEERMAVPLLHCAHLLAARRCYGGNMRARKLLGLDEAHFMNGWPSGRAFLVRLARDSRKWNLAALLASQNPADILDFDVQNLVSTVFVGRVADDPRVAEEALRLLRVADTPDGRYRQLLAGLSQQAAGADARLGFREFVMRDVDGRVQKLHVDLSWSGLLEHLDTTPGGVR